jgi:hypothetical protein
VLLKIVEDGTRPLAFRRVLQVSRLLPPL